DPFGRACHCPALGGDRYSLFSAGPGDRLRTEPRSHAGCAGGYYIAVALQSAVRPLGLAGDVVASPRTPLPHLAVPAAFRSFQTHVGGWLLGLVRLGQLGSAKSALEFRV